MQKKILKNKDIHNVSLACIIESMLKILILFCEIWVLTPSFFDTPLRPHYPISSPQIKQENWLTHCSMKIQNYLCDKLGFYFLDFFMSQYPLLFVDSILMLLWIRRIKWPQLVIPIMYPNLSISYKSCNLI